MHKPTLISAIYLLTVLPVLAQQTDILLGHYEIHIDYQVTAAEADSGWLLSLSYDEDNDFNDGEGITRLDPSTVRLIAAPGTKKAISSALTGLGKVGNPLWLLPQNNVPGQLFLGLRTVIEPGVFQSSVNGFFSPSTLGNIALEMVSLVGTGADAGGHFAVWENKALGSLEFHFDSSDGFPEGDRIEPVPIGSHTHYNWGMTKPGSYQVTFRASGRLNPWQLNGGQDTSFLETFTFIVPFSGCVSEMADLRMSTSSTPPASVYDALEVCEYAPGQVALVTATTDYQGAAVPYGFWLTLDSSAGAASNRVGITGLDAIALPAGITLASPGLELLRADGPGNVRLFESSPGQVLLDFDEPGIYRLQMRAILHDPEDNQIPGQPFTLTFLAGLPIDYDYAAYADSFERQHQLEAGTLADPLADFDQDTVPNGIEYQLFWHGFDPAMPDAYLLPSPSFENGYWGITFLRDTYKDDFSLGELSLGAAYSSDFLQWTAWHTEFAGKPLAPVFEDGVGAETLGRIMKRRLRVQEAGVLSLFRFQLF